MWRHARILTTTYAKRCDILGRAVTKRSAIGVVAGGVLTTRVITCKKEDETWCEFAKSAVQNALNVCQEEIRKKPRGIVAILGVNCVVFGLWRVSFYHRGMHRWMWRHFACSYDAVFMGKRFHTLVTSAFSQNTLPHLAINMFMLWEFGSQIVDARVRVRNALMEAIRKRFRRKKLTENEFLAVYMGATIVSSTTSVVASRYRGMRSVYTLGASGCVMAVFTLYCVMYPEERLLLYGLFDCSALDMLRLTTAGNVIGVAYQRRVPIDFVGHLAGQATGYAFDKRWR
uniref:Serine protease family S54 putative n=1 Tax=Albugo laibachii Nc14 TaxID=890382 RepID=F0WGH0_9STRA|nr:serine protease family S54 putative [Albugo laibachii Nc14]|eukprot:CCA20333.1 serine protease family S54 putative [Albugo laibachii Nc14]